MAQTKTSCELIFQQAEWEYRAAEGISQSELKEILISPAHHQARYGPNAEPMFPTPAMQLGTAAHHKVLEPNSFDQHYVSKVESNGVPNIPELKAIAKEQGIDIKGKTKKDDLVAAIYPDGVPKEKRKVLSEKDWLIVAGIHNAIQGHEVLAPWFDASKPGYQKTNEVSIYARDYLGITRKGRIDRLMIDEEAGVCRILDLKTTQSCDPHDFTGSMVRSKYHLQAFWYSDLVRRAMDAELLPQLEIEFYFVAVEKVLPYALNVFRAPQQLIYEGSRLADRALHTYAQCKELEFWPGLDPVIHELKLPSWATLRDEDAIG